MNRTQAPALRQNPGGNNDSKPQMQFLLGPHRVFPGRLSVIIELFELSFLIPNDRFQEHLVI